MPCHLPKFSLPFVTISILVFCSTNVTNAVVPASNTFKYVNEGELGEYYVEYGADYRVLPTYLFPFQLCFYNTTPNAFTLALRMGSHRSESVMRWVWEANRGRPVRENATLTLGSNGNLVLADADGTVAWQTGTANKGVVGLKLLQNGNLVLYDKKGNFIWQSFDHPTDTLLVGQSLRANGPNKLVSRTSMVDGSEGPYSFVIEQRYLKMYYKSKNSPSPLLYYRSYGFGNGKETVANVKLYSSAETEQAYAYEVGLTYDMKGSTSSRNYMLSRPKYNTKYSFLRVEHDGNLKIYTYNENVDWGSWDNAFTLFDGDVDRESQCNLPMRCGSLGICEDNQCVACPRPKGLIGWSKSCSPPVLPPCKGGGANVGYYKVVGVEHFSNKYVEGDGPMKLNDCRAKCSNDCGCLGFFYREESSKCLRVPELGSLVKVADPLHVAYIKMAM